MSQPIIQIDSIGKAYYLGKAAVRHEMFRDALISMLTAPFRRLKELRRLAGGEDQFWALRNVSFNVQQGEVVGIIGRNGAGKSTLLKILSRITEPTEGQVTLRGRVASLLEVGTGFHPDLTGRENVYLNGAILGMSKAEITRKFDEIVAFSEIEKFLDTPVKHYSSGMYVRLAFAVAAHLEPEILIIDEVLAVGDVEFQKKCLGKMRQMSARGGRTVLFVSHNMLAIQALCTRGILLSSGSIAVAGTVAEAVSAYVNMAGTTRSCYWTRPETALEAPLTIESVTLEVLGMQPRHILRCRVKLRTCGHFSSAIIAIDVHDPFGSWLMQAVPRVDPFISSAVPAHDLAIDVQLPPLIPGTYVISVWVGNGLTQTIDWAREVTAFDIVDSPTPGRTIPHSSDRGFCVPISSVSVDATR